MVDPVESGDCRKRWTSDEYQVLLYEFKADLNSYLQGLGPKAPREVAGGS